GLHPDEAEIPACGAEGGVALVEDGHLGALGGEAVGDGGADHAAADDDDVECFGHGTTLFRQRATILRLDQPRGTLVGAVLRRLYFGSATEKGPDVLGAGDGVAGGADDAPRQRTGAGAGPLVAEIGDEGEDEEGIVAAAGPDGAA